MRSDPAVVLAENLIRRGIPAWPSTDPDGHRVRVEGAAGAPSSGLDVHCHPHGGYVTAANIQLGTVSDPDATADLIMSLYGKLPDTQPNSRGR